MCCRKHLELPVRREFPDKVKVEAFKRANKRCENCTAPLYPGKYRYDHRIPDQLGGEPTLQNCWVICTACDKSKTRSDQKDIGHARRVFKKHAGVKKRRSITGWKNFKGEPVRAPRER
jgi:5-methylcytosine-specific restriction enzyme A